MGNRHNVHHIHNTLRRKLNPLRLEIKKQPEHLFFSDRTYRGRFCQIVREFRGYSREEVCVFLNSHSEIPALLKRYPHFTMLHPFTPESLEKFETKVEQVFEYCAQGFFLGGMGFPTFELVRLIVEFCSAKDEHLDFLGWCAERVEVYKPKPTDRWDPLPPKRRLFIVAEKNGEVCKSPNESFSNRPS